MYSMERSNIILLVISCLFSSSSAVGFSQTVEIRGKLLCNDQPAAGVLLKLYEKGVLFDNLMKSVNSDSNGEYSIGGTETEISTIDPQLNIYHDCDDGWTPCQRRISIKIPDSYISKGKSANKVFDMGTLQLAGKFKGETRDCIHRRRR